MKVVVTGLGYMGIPTAALLAENGHQVYGVDINPERVAQINNGTCPFNEKGLPEMLEKVCASGMLTAGMEMREGDVFLVTVPTPEKDHKADLSFIESALNMIAPVLRDNDLVIIESTVPPSTCNGRIASKLDKTGKNYLLAHCPERAIPGDTLNEIVNNDRIVGGLTDAASEKAKLLYSSFVKGEIFLTDITTAEAVKLMENTYRDINIAYANTIMKLSDELGFNPAEAIKLANRHPRVNILNPGPGVGGHCIPIDPWFLTEKTKNNELIITAREVNMSMPEFWVAKMENLFLKQAIKNAKIGILGVAYKPGVDDARESPATDIIRILVEKGYDVKASDPYVSDYMYELYPLDDIQSWADVLMIVTSHADYNSITGDNILVCE